MDDYKLGEKVKKIPYRLLDLLFLSIWYIKVLLYKTDFAVDYDLGWHLKTGEWIWQNKAIPFFDLFLASDQPRAWVCDQWLGDLILYLLQSNFGWIAPALFFLSIFLVIFFVLIYDFCVKQSKSAYATIYVISASFLVATIHLIIRPVVFSFLFFTWLLIKLYSIEIEAKNNNQWIFKNSDILKIFLIFVLWSNTHPSFFLGLFLIVLFIISFCIEKVLKIGEVPFKFIKKSTVVFVISVFGTLCNPNGYNLYFPILKLINSSYYTSLYREWGKPSYTNLRFIILVSFFVIIIINWVISKRENIFKSIFNIGTIFLAGYLMFKAYRMFPYVAILLAYPATMAIKNIFARCYVHFSKYKFLRISSEVNEIEANGKSLALIGCCILTCFSMWYCIHYNKSYLFEPKQRKPVIVALQKVADSIPDGEYRVILTGVNFGGLVPYYGEGKLKAIIDDRSTIFEEDYVKIVSEKISSKDDWLNLFEEFGAEYFLIDNTSEIKPAVHEVLDVFYSNDEVTVFERKHNG